MAQGSSGRIVIDVDPEFKRELHDALRQSGSTLKDWFLKHATKFCEEQNQPLLLHVAESPTPYTTSRQTAANSTPQPDGNENTEN